MKTLLINCVCGIRSTGRICTDIAEEMEKQGNEVKIAYGRETVPEKYQKYAVRIGTEWSVRKNALSCRLFDNDGFVAKRATKKFLEWADKYDPDLLWLHNIHGYYINIEMLFAWIKSRPNMQVKWTLHSCWAFTGHCSYFTIVKCEQWKTHCSYCAQKRGYPASYFKDNCASNFDRKKAAFTGVQNMTIYTVSNWLANLTKQSFLGEYPIEVKYNKVDTTVFKPTPGNFRERYDLTDKKIVLGVASSWSKRKGLSDFIKLSEMLDENYQIVLVGLTDKQIKKLPKQILGIKRTNSTTELAKIYTAADVFVNPSKEETFGMTTVEALSCGTPAIVYKDTACEEIVNMLGRGRAVDQDIDALYTAVMEETKNCKKEN